MHRGVRVVRWLLDGTGVAMIAHLTISPVAKWCEPARAALLRHMTDEMEPSTGCIVSIAPTTMRTSKLCGGREWRVVGMDSSIATIEPFSGEELDPEKYEGWVCEHMLEMD